MDEYLSDITNDTVKKLKYPFLAERACNMIVRMWRQSTTGE